MTKTEKLIEEAFALREEIMLLASHLDERERAIIALGPGKHSGAVESHEVNVVAAGEGGVSYKLSEKNLDAAKEIAGGNFAKLFDRLVTFEPCEAFATVGPKLLEKCAWKKLAALLGKPFAGKAAYILYPKVPRS